MDIFKKLHIKMIIGTVAVVASVLAILLGSLNSYNIVSSYNHSISMAKEIAKNNGHLFPMQNKNFDNLDRMVFVPESDSIEHQINDKIFEDGNFLEFMFPSNADDKSFLHFFSTVTKSDGTFEFIFDFPIKRCQVPSEFKEVVRGIRDRKNSQGIYNGFLYLKENRNEGVFTVYIDRRNEINLEKRLVMYSIFIFVILLILACAGSIVIVHFLMKPTQEAFERQKRFISDAGHELKTPIAVISANIDVLRSEIPENKWLEYIRTENERMSKLVKDLLYLANSDAGHQKFNLASFDLSNAINIAALPFECVIFEHGKKLKLNVADGMSIIGDEQRIKQVIVILIDNAIKNSEKGATIELNAFNDGNRKIIKVYNTGRGISKSDRDKIFERFYRVDTSRDRKTGGYGLGLSIAQAIVNAHDGTISVDSVLGEWIEFTVSLPDSPKEYHKYLKH